LASIACEEGVAPALLDALVAHESRYNPAARSGRGAIGLTQLMPGTVTSLGIANPWDIVQNLRAGARYLRRQLDAFGRYDLALAAYNAGPGQVTRHNGVPPFAETRAYVDNVLGMMLGSSTMSPAKVAMQLAYRSKHTGQPGPRAVLVQQFLADAPAP
jgi:soluble lytic murein transglycosylase-like protein